MTSGEEWLGSNYFTRDNSSKCVSSAIKRNVQISNRNGRVAMSKDTNEMRGIKVSLQFKSMTV